MSDEPAKIVWQGQEFTVQNAEITGMPPLSFDEKEAPPVSETITLSLTPVPTPAELEMQRRYPSDCWIEQYGRLVGVARNLPLADPCWGLD